MKKIFYKISPLMLLYLFFLMGICEISAQRVRPYFQPTRALLMGDAYTAYDLGFESVFYNPAGVAKKNKSAKKFIDLEMWGSQAMFTVLPSLAQLQGLSEIIANNPGAVHSLGLAFSPQFIVKNFSIGAMVRTYVEGIVDPTSFDFDYYGYSDIGIYTHWGASFLGGIVKVGAGAKFLDRAEVERTFSEAEYTGGGLSLAEQWREGVGYGFDAGILVQLPTAGLPAFGISVQEIGNTQLLDRRFIFTGSSGTPGSPPNLRQRVNLGVALNLKHSPGVKSGLAFDVKDALYLADNTIERLHLGWELSVNNSVFVRAGVNQGRYWTAGVAFKLAGIILEGGTYGENLLFGTGSRRDDRKYVGRYAIVF